MSQQPLIERPLTELTVMALFRLIEGCQQTQSVKWSPDGGETIRSGLLRRIGTYDGERFTETDDVRAMHVHITTDTGFEYWLLASDAIDMMGRGEFAIQKG